MHEESASTVLSPRAMLVRFAVLIGAALLVGIGGASTVLEAHQATACAVFVAIIFGTLFFWGFRLAIAFLGLAVLIFTNSLNIPQFVSSSSLEVILFLVGMMVIVGALRDLGFFTWIVQLIVSMPHLTGRKFTAVTATSSQFICFIAKDFRNKCTCSYCAGVSLAHRYNFLNFIWRNTCSYCAVAGQCGRRSYHRVNSVIRVF